ncbi:helix-turn-helix domain-containing protein [Natrinema sp. LN54]|uniref:helix-turn-helix domain-containing protein n=1 Tax=Natrinema sp. LN54 TaxID=3458705 RepID=UPI00403756B5
MITEVDVSVPAESFALGQLLREHPDATVELERRVPLGEGTVIPQFWVTGVEETAIEASFGESPLVEWFERLAGSAGSTLYEVQWASDINGLVQSLVDVGADLLQAEGTDEDWDFRIQFKDHADLAAFRRVLRAEGIPLTLHKISNPTVVDEEQLLTAEQSDALVTAYKEGYFEVPRGIDQAELAALLGISDSSLSQRLRRGTARIVQDLYEGGRLRT